MIHLKAIKIAIIGYGNVGKYAVEAVNSAEDMELCGIVVRRNAQDIKVSVPVTDDIANIGKVDVAILCVPSRSIEENAIKYLKMGINTVDSFDIHSSIYKLKSSLDIVCKEKSAVSMISAGWDPGLDSIIRALLEASAPKGITYTNFGPGMSMGHSVAAKSIEGVRDAMSLTVPLGSGIHRRMVYVEIEEGFSLERVASAIKSDAYFSHDETHVIPVKSIDSIMDRGSGVSMQRKGVSGVTDNQLFEYRMKINNPALTAQIMVACARASIKQKPGAYTMIEIPPIDLLYGENEKLINTLV